VEVPDDAAGPNLYVDVPLDGTRVVRFPFGAPPTAPKVQATSDLLGTRAAPDGYGPTWIGPGAGDYNNKAFNRVFLRITVGWLDEGLYTLVVSKSTNATARVRVQVYEGSDRSSSWDNSANATNTDTSPITTVGKIPLKQGTYLVEISSGADSANIYTGPVNFTVWMIKG
jgi:hypothetical protein